MNFGSESVVFFQRRYLFQTFTPILSHVNKKEENAKYPKFEISQFPRRSPGVYRIFGE